MTTPCPAADGSSPKQQQFDGPPPMCIDVNKRYTASMVTSKGTLTIALDPSAAPQTVNNFVFLARYHYFDGIVFHRIIPGFVLQGGDPTGTGRGGPGYRFADELPKPGRYELGFAGHGERRAQHERQSVLRDQWAVRGAAAAPVLPVREGGRRVGRGRRPSTRWHVVGHAQGDGDDRVGDGHRGRMR